MRLSRMFLKVLARASKAKGEKAGRAPAGWDPRAFLPASTMYLCSLRQVHHSVRLEVVLVLPAEYSSDDDDDDCDHGDGCQHRGNDPQVVGRVLHHSCGKEPARST